MQNAKDTFFKVLRDRLAALNPERTVLVRGVIRPALVADENETQSVAALPECFHLHWGATDVNCDGTLPCVTMQCEIGYETAGTVLNAGLDRGRVLAAMDAELMSALVAAPQNAQKLSFAPLATGGAPQEMLTRIWWSAPEFEDCIVHRDRIGRKLKMLVMSFEEQGEL